MKNMEKFGSKFRQIRSWSPLGSLEHSVPRGYGVYWTYAHASVDVIVELPLQTSDTRRIALHWVPTEISTQQLGCSPTY